MTSASEVDEALRILRECFTYEPQERWLPPYRVLEEALSEINRAMRPVAALHLAAFVGVVGLILLNLNRNAFSEFWLYVMVALFFAPALAALAMRLFIVGRFPLVRRQGEIEEVIKPFRAVAPSLMKAINT